MRMYKKISIGLILCAVLLPNIASAAAYSDIAGHLDEKYVVGYSDLGLVNGYPDGTFRPDVTLTRAEATVLFGKLNLPAINGKQTDFRDIAKTDWFYNSVDAAVKSGLVSGYEDHTFQPQKTITRFEAIFMVSKLVKSEKQNTVQLPYGDRDNIPSWVNSAVRNLYAAGVIDTYSGNRIAGNTPVTRSEMVKMLYKVLESYQFQLTDLSQAVKSTGTTGATAVQLPHDILGYLTIERIGIKKYPVKDGADLATIKTAIGHFAESALWDGNVAFCAHNRDYKYDFRNLKNIKKGDKVIYETRFGTRTYTVSVIKAINETDWTDITMSDERNKLTMVTCIENEPTKRLLVQAVQQQ